MKYLHVYAKQYENYTWSLQPLFMQPMPTLHSGHFGIRCILPQVSPTTVQQAQQTELVIYISCAEKDFASLLNFSASFGFFSTPSPSEYILLTFAHPHECPMSQLFKDMSKAFFMSFGTPSVPVK